MRLLNPLTIARTRLSSMKTSTRRNIGFGLMLAVVILGSNASVEASDSTSLENRPPNLSNMMDGGPAWNRTYHVYSQPIYREYNAALYHSRVSINVGGSGLTQVQAQAVPKLSTWRAQAYACRAYVESVDAANGIVTIIVGHAVTNTNYDGGLQNCPVTITGRATTPPSSCGPQACWSVQGVRLGRHFDMDAGNSH